MSHPLMLVAGFIISLVMTNAASAAVPLPREKPGAGASGTSGVSEVPASGPAAEAIANLQKKFTLEGFFTGETIAKGTIFSKTVGASRSFNASTVGTWDGKVLTLVETYQYAAGDREQRIWRFTKKGDGVYAAESGEILKPTKVVINGRVAKLKYQKKIPRPGGKKPIKVTFVEEWALRKDGMLVSKTNLKKLVSVGREVINFVRVGNEATLKAPGF